MGKRVLKSIAIGLGTGNVPFAPGSVGSLLGIPLYFILAPLSLPLQVISLITFTCLAIYIAHFAESEFDKKDPSAIVIDEIVGMMWALCFIPLTLFNIIAAFLLFRFFDIFKIFPANYLEKRLKGGWAIVLDDVVAGIYAGALLWLITTIYPI